VEVALPDFTRGADKNFAALVGRTYEGTLGKDFLERFVVELDYGRQTAQLHDPATFHYAGKAKVFALRFAGAMPVVRVKFDFAGKTYDADFAVNTALDAPIRIYPRYAAAHRMLGSHPHIFPATDEPLDAKAAAVRFKSFQIGTFMIASPRGEISEPALPSSGDAKLAGEIGGGMLGRFVVILDYTHQQMILDAGNKFPDDDWEDMSGISLIAKGPGLKTFEVVAVAPGTPGADAKIQKGDVIAGVDTDPAADLTLFEMRDLFRQVGHTYKLLVQRNGQDIPVTIQMRRLL
jgi:membrane-associated protease RseP (regulator of RpoE activity)